MKSNTFLNGELVRAYRKANGITLQELAARSGIRLETLCRLELGRRPAALSTLKKLSIALDLGVAELVKGD